MKTLKTRKAYSFESTLENHFSSFTNEQLVDKLYSLEDEISKTLSEILQGKLRIMKKMVNRELMKRDLAIA